MALRKSKPKDPVTQFMDDLKSELDALVMAYMEKFPNTSLGKTFPCVTSLMGASSMIGIIKNMIKK